MPTPYYNWLLDELVTRYGEGAIDRVMAAYSTARVSVPQKPTALMLANLGDDIAIWLCDVRGGQDIHIPSVSSVNRRRKIATRNREIQTSGESVKDLAKRHDLSQRLIRNIKSRACRASKGRRQWTTSQAKLSTSCLRTLIRSSMNFTGRCGQLGIKSR